MTLTKPPDKFWQLLVVLLLGLTTTGLVYNHREKEEVKEQLAATQNEWQACLAAGKAMASIMARQWQLAGCKMRKGLLVRNRQGKTVLLDSLVEKYNDQLLVLRFSWRSCQDCQLQEINYIQQLRSSHRAVIIASFETFRDFELYMQTYKVALPAYFLESGKDLLANRVENSSDVYSFITDSTYQMTRVHVGSTSFPQLSQTYYQTILVN